MLAKNQTLHRGTADAVAARLHALQNAGYASLLCRGRKGLEKESLRISTEGRLAQTPHPRALGSALTHPYITTDYAEALPELITPSFTDVRDTIRFLRDLHIFVHQRLDNELLWAASMPCTVSDDRNIRVAEYGSSNIGRLKHVYRIGLDYRYGRRMQAIAGVHYNYSLPIDFWPAYQQLERDSGPLRQFIDDRYFGLIRNFKRLAWLILYLCGDSSAVCRSFLGGRTTRYSQLEPGTYFLPDATSLRMSDIGYKNKNQAALHISYDDLTQYVTSLQRAIATPYPEYEVIGVKANGQYLQLNTNVLQIENEFYSLVRPKRTTLAAEKPTHALRARGVEYVEIRALDLDSASAIGVNEDQLRFLESLLIFCLLEHSPTITTPEQQEFEYNELTVALRGREPGVHLLDNGDRCPLTEWARTICDRLQGICELLDHSETGAPYQHALSTQAKKIEEPESLPSARLLAALRREHLSYARYVLQLSSEHQRDLRGQQIAADRLAAFEASVAESLAQQAQLEATDEITFDEYLRRYLAAG